MPFLKAPRLLGGDGLKQRTPEEDLPLPPLPVEDRLLEELNRAREKEIKLKPSDTQALIVYLKRHEKPELKGVNSKVLQMINHLLWSNVRTLAEKKKRGHKVGKLRFKGRSWFKSFAYNQSGFELVTGWGKRCRLLHLSKIGDIPVRWHREMPRKAELKGVILKRERDGSWWAVRQAELPEPPDPMERLRELDYVSLTAMDFNTRGNYVTDSAGNAPELPKPYQKAEKRQSEERKKLSRKCKGSSNYEKQRVKVAKLERKVKDQRNDYQHKLSTFYVETHEVIAWESMRIQPLMESMWNARGFWDAALGRFGRLLAYKAESAGKLALPLPAELLNASRTCFACGIVLPEPLPEKRQLFACPACGYVEDRHYNAALITHRAALQWLRGSCRLDGEDEISLGPGQPEVTPAERRPLCRIAAETVVAGQVDSTKREAHGFSQG